MPRFTQKEPLCVRAAADMFDSTAVLSTGRRTNLPSGAWRCFEAAEIRGGIFGSKRERRRVDKPLMSTRL